MKILRQKAFSAIGKAAKVGLVLGSGLVGDAIGGKIGYELSSKKQFLKAKEKTLLQDQKDLEWAQNKYKETGDTYYLEMAKDYKKHIKYVKSLKTKKDARGAYNFDRTTPEKIGGAIGAIGGYVGSMAALHKLSK